MKDINDSSFALNKDTISGIMMIFACFAAVAASNIPAISSHYHNFIGYVIPVKIGPILIVDTIKQWTQDALMVLFFLNVTMELKIELRQGVLSDRGQVLLPLVAAICGMIVPAIIYLIINWQFPDNFLGAAIPCATDIAFAVCIFNLAANSAPVSIRIFLLSIAIFDDLGAIVIIAFVYAKSVALYPLLLTALGVGLLLLLNRYKVSTFIGYIAITIFIWFGLHEVGIHTTLAGVILGMAMPLHNKTQNYSPLKSLLKIVNPLVLFFILPFFAFVACDLSFVGLTLSSLFSPVAFGIFLGLFLGKQIGIFGSTWLLIKYKVVSMPRAGNWFYIYFVSCIAGIGFTMSLFMGELAFTSGHVQNLAKTGIICASILSALWAVLIMKIFNNLTNKTP